MKRSRSTVAAGLCCLLSCLALSHCSSPQQADPKAPLLPKRAKEPTVGAAGMASPEDVAAARLVFASRCQMCHGANGQGDGTMAAMLTPKPRSFADRQWQQQTGDEAIAAIILRGGQAVGRSASMPAMPELSQKPNVLAGLVKLVRTFGQ